MARFFLLALSLLISQIAGFQSAVRSHRHVSKSLLRSVTDSPSTTKEAEQNIVVSSPNSDRVLFEGPSVADQIISLAVDVFDNAKTSYGIFSKRLSEGDDFKQALADTLAGPDLDVAEANAKIDEIISSHPCVVFGWSLSPFSKKAVRYLDSMGVDMKIVDLDKPWEEGNPIRAALGRRVGRTSVPFIFVGGNYIGGCEDGPSAECAGLIPLALQGKLRPLLIEAGALKPSENVDYAPGYARRMMLTAVADASENKSTPGSIAKRAGQKEAEPFVSMGASEEFDSDCPSDGCELP